MSTLDHALNAIPEDLRNGRRSVVWRFGAARPDGKRAKVPCDPVSGMHAKVSDPTTWGSFEAALRALDTSRYNGVGHVLTADDGLVAIDLDDAVDPTGRPAAWASKIIERLDTYCEFSPGGRGVHLWARASLPTAGRRSGRVELYASSRFMTLTGVPVPGSPAAVHERQRTVDELLAELFPPPAVATAPTVSSPTPVKRFLKGQELTDDQIIKRAMTAPQSGYDFAMLWYGHRDEHRSPSEADYHLVRLLARQCGHDPERIERLCWRSKLARDKWSRGDYLARTIDSVLCRARNIRGSDASQGGAGSLRSGRTEAAR